MLLQSRCQRLFFKPVNGSRKCYSLPTESGGHTPGQQPKGSHHDLPSFLAYAARVNIDPKSTVYVGTHYEYTVQSALERLGLILKRVGGRSDYGIDLLGTWNLPSTPLPLKVLAQCKARVAKPTPGEVRELEGAFVGAPVGWRDSAVLALLVSQKEATKGVRDALGRSRWPMGFVMCTGQGRILQMLWNKRAEDEGLFGVDVIMKYAGDDREKREILLTWEGENLSNGVSNR